MASVSSTNSPSQELSGYSESRRRRLESLRAQLELDRSSFESYWQDLSDFILPARARFTITDDAKGDRRNQKIIDTTGSLAARTFASNLMAGYTSPARIWFRLTTGDAELAEVEEHKEWLFTVTRLMSASMLRSNLYNQLPVHYKAWGTFATSVLFVEEDLDRVAFLRVLPIGSYWLSNDEKGRCRTIMRKFRMTVRQVIEKFGKKDDKGNVTNWENISDYVREQARIGQWETRIEVVHFVLPNDDYRPGSADPTKKMYKSCYYESGSSDARRGNYDASFGDYDRFLSESGYDYFPALAVRYELSEGDAYGIDCPGMTAIGDIKQLQLMHKRKAQALEKTVNPPMNAPGSMRSVKMSTLPGEVNYLNTRTGEQGFTPVYQVNFNVQQLVEDIARTQQRIESAFFTNFFLALSNDFRNQRATAREVEEIHDEKIAMVGPLLEQLNWEQSDPLIEIWFNLMLRQGKLPLPPEGLQGENLKVEYISIMSSAQKQIGVGTMERFAGFIAPFAQAYPSVADKIDADEFVDEYADSLGVPPRIVRSDEEVAGIREERAAQVEQQQAIEAAQMAAKTARDLGSAKLDDQNVLGRLVGQSEEEE